MREASMVTYGGHIIDYQTGTLTSVEFNFLRIWNLIKTVHYDFFHPRSLGFYHVHPENCCDISEKDKECMKGLSIAFGCPIFSFTIICFKNADLFNTNYNLITYYYNAKSNALIEIDTWALSNDQLLFLKYLSYGELKCLGN